MNYDNALVRARASYTSAPACIAELARYTATERRLAQAHHMLRVALEPRGRSGLSASDIPAEVVSALREQISLLTIADEPRREQVRALASEITALRNQGHAWDTVWSWTHEQAAPLGFGPGDSGRLYAAIASWA